MQECSFCPGHPFRVKRYFVYDACPACQKALPIETLLKREIPRDPALEAHILEADIGALHAYSLFGTEVPRVSAHGLTNAALEGFEIGESRPEFADVFELAIRAALLFGWGPRRPEDNPPLVDPKLRIHDVAEMSSPGNQKLSDRETWIQLRLAAGIQQAMVHKLLAGSAPEPSGRPSAIPKGARPDSPASIAAMNGAVRKTSENIGRLFIDAAVSARDAGLEGPARELEAWKLARMS